MLYPRLLRDLKELCQDAVRDAPDDVGSVPHRRVGAASLFEFDQDLIDGVGVAERGEWYPERGVDLAVVGVRDRVRVDSDDEGRDHDRWQPRRSGVHLVERAEESSGVRDVDARLLAGFAERRGEEGAVSRPAFPAGQRHMAGPGIGLVERAFDQEEFDLFAGAQHEGHGGLEGAEGSLERVRRSMLEVLAEPD